MRHVHSWRAVTAILAMAAATFTHAQQAAPSAAKPDSTNVFTVTTAGGTSGYIPQFLGTSTVGNSILFATGNSVGIGTIPNASAKLDVGGSMIMRGTMTVSRTGNATTAKGFPSYGFDFFSNVYNSSTHAAQNAYFSLQSEPAGNNTSSPSATFNLLYSTNGAAPAETGLAINPNGTLHFSPAQTFPIAAGPTGPQGPPGPTGPTGATGPQGPEGAISLPFVAAVNTNGGYVLRLVNSDAVGGGGIYGAGGTAPNQSDITGGPGLVGQGGPGSGISESAGGSGIEAIGGYGGPGDSAVGGIGGLFIGGSVSASGFGAGEGVLAQGGDSPTAGLGGTGIIASPGMSSSVAGEFIGDVQVGGTLTQSAASLKIDNPTDPENKYLYHSSVESPDMKNIYDGIVVTDGAGAAVVTLPDWFEPLNRDFRYQLTVVGQVFAQALVSSEIANGSFTIRTDKPNVKVSWQVTGIRQDAWANAHRVPVEEEKAARDRGKFIHPELFGKPDDPSIEEARHPGLSRIKKARQAASPNTP